MTLLKLYKRVSLTAFNENIVTPANYSSLPAEASFSVVVSKTVVSATEVGPTARAPLIVVFSFCPLSFVLRLATNLVKLALVILPLFAQTGVVHCYGRSTVAKVLLHRKAGELKLREVSLWDVFATAVLLA